MRKWINLIESEGELLSEIVDIEHNESDEEMFASDVPLFFKQYRNRLVKSGSFNGFDLYTNMSRMAYNSHKLFFVKPDTEEPIGMINYKEVDFPGVGDAYQVTLVYVKPEYRGKGLASYFYKKLLDDGKVLRSDKSQAPGGRKMWQRLANDPKYEVTIVGDAMVASLKGSQKHTAKDLAGWFGSSIVRQEGGEPKIVYAPDDYAKRIATRGYVTVRSNYSTAHEVGTPVTVYLKITDPLFFGTKAKKEDIDRLAKVGLDVSHLVSREDVWMFLDNNTINVIEAAKRAGYDGFVVHEDENEHYPMYYMFDTNNIKMVKLK